MDDWFAWLRLQLTPGLGRAALFRLIGQFGAPQAALEQSRDWHLLKGLRRGLAAQVPAESDPRLKEGMHCLQNNKARIVTFWEADFPPLLKTIPDPPVLLYVRGTLAKEERRLAIVGSRRPTQTALTWTEQLAAELAVQGISTVSGLARGIDGAAHRGSLVGKGRTIAVLGCGIDRVYPAEHGEMFCAIAEQGAILSEYPPGTDPLPGHFPGRNRIISGLSQGVLVVEADRNSGSLITAEFALEQGREVFAVPGGIDRPTSSGTNQLLKEGAHPATELEDVVGVLWPGSERRSHPPVDSDSLDDLSPPAREVLRHLGTEPRNIDELAGKTGLTPMELSVILLHLELQGKAEALPGASYIRRGSDLFHQQTWGTD